MATQYTTILKLALPVTGELSGTWGDTVNNNITSMVEQAVAGLATINSWTANAHTLTVANGTTSESRCAILIADDDGAGNPSAAAEIICPDASKLYVLKNISGQQVTLKTSAGTGVAVPNGDIAFLFCDGTNVEACVTTIINGHISGNLTVDGNTTLGDSSSDTITATARFNTDLLPSTDNTRDLGSTGNSWKDLYIDGTAYLALVDINGGAIDGVTLGTNSAVTEAQIDNVNINGNTISSTNTDGDLTLEADGTGNINLNADTVRVGDNNANATVTTNGTGDLILNTNAGTNSGTVTIQDGVNGNIVLTPNGVGEVDISKVDIDAGAIDGTAIGANSASTGKFTSVTDTALTSGRVTFATTNGELTDSANLAFNGTDLTVSGAVNATTVDTTNIEVTNIKAKDGTAAGSIADSTGVVTLASSVLTTTDINGGTIDGTAIGGASAAAGAFTTLNTSGAVVFNDAGADVDFRVEGDTDANLLFVDAGNDRIGVGTDTPQTTFHVVGTPRIVATAIQMTASDISARGVISMDANGNLGFESDGGNNIGGSFMPFSVDASERMRIDSAGRLMVGASSFAAGVGSSVMQIIQSPSSSTTAALLLSYDSSSPSAGQTLGRIEFSNNNHIGAASIASQRDTGTWTSGSSHPSRLIFSTTADGSGSTTERMRITSAGDVGIGTTAPIRPLVVKTGTSVSSVIKLCNSDSGETLTDGLDLAFDGANGYLSVRESGFLSLSTDDTERMRITSAGDVGIGATAPTARSHVVQLNAARALSTSGNSNSQGSASLNTIVRHYPVVSLGTKLIIPFVSQGSLNSGTICRIIGHGARFNTNAPLGFTINFAVGHLSTLSNLTSWGGGGNYSSTAINGMNIEITFTTAYTSATANGVFVTIEYMTNNINNSIDVTNIAMN